MITLYAFDPGLGLPSASPFVTKAMILLKMAGQPFDVEIVQDLSSAPKGKLPYLRDGDEVIADSDIIRRHLETRYGLDADRGLSTAERACGLALTRLAEEHLYWCAMYSHWQIDRHWVVIKQMFFAALPPDQRDMIAEDVRKQVLRDLHGQGMGRHSHEEMLDFARDDLQAIAGALGDQAFLFGDEPRSADAAVAPQVLAIAKDPFDGPLNEAVDVHPTLVPYAERVLARFFPDWQG